jgi:hypothetical protein
MVGEDREDRRVRVSASSRLLEAQECPLRVPQNKKREREPVQFRQL